MLSTSYPRDRSDWRGTFIRNIIEVLAKENSIDLSVWQPPGETPASARQCMTLSDADWLDRLMRSGGIAHQLRSNPAKGVVTAVQLVAKMKKACLRYPNSDVWHANWLQNALAIPAGSRGLVTTVLGTDLSLLKIPGMVSLLRRKFRNRKTVICPNSQWMVQTLSDYFGDIANVEYLPFGIGKEWYDVKRIPSKCHRWLCVSRVTPGKIGDLFEWGESVFSKSDRELHLIGPNQAGMKIPNWVHYHGSVSPQELQSFWFPSSTGLITLSRHSEGRPQVMLEAMASAMPVIASDLAAHSDFINHRETGWICKDEESLFDAVNFLSNESKNQLVGQQARESIHAISGTWPTYANRLVRIYKSLATP